MTPNKIPNNMNFAQNQVFGNQQPIQHIQQQDIINSIRFDPTGELLAIGDNAGRIILFKQQDDEFGYKKSFEYYSEFQSHVPEFDSLKSMSISQSITDIKWLRPQGKYHKMITSNSNCIKLWKMFEKVQTKVILTGERESLWDQGYDLTMPLLNRQTSFTSNAQIIFPIKHQSDINQAQVAKNEEYIFSTDQERGIFWSFQKYQSPFIVQEIKSKKYWKEGEKISCSKLHPITDNIFTVGTTKGRVELNDLRASMNGRKNSQFLFQNKVDKSNDYFREMTTKINSLEFLAGGKYIVARDYLTVKLWDVCRTSQPVAVVEINPNLRQKMCHLFENDCIEDQFQISSFSDNLLVTGNYDNRFHVIDPLGSKNVEYTMDFDHKNAKKHILRSQKKSFGPNFDCNKKVLACGVHQQSSKIALASLNSFFIYYPQKQGSQRMQIEM